MRRTCKPVWANRKSILARVAAREGPIRGPHSLILSGYADPSDSTFEEVRLG